MTVEKRPLRVLALADACNPQWPSLPIVGYKYAKALADVAEVTVVTQVRNRPNLEAAGFGRAQVDYLDTEWIAGPLQRLATLLRGGPQKAWTLQQAMDYPGYIAFEHATWRRWRDALRQGRFDVVHRITPMSPTLPSPLAKWSPVPFVLGPLNGHLPWPAAFSAEQQRERERFTLLRPLARLMPYHRATYRRSAAVLAAFEHTLDYLPAEARPRAVNFPEVGIDPEVFAPATRAPTDRLTVLYVGRLVPYKLPEVVVRAFAASPALRRHRLLVVGDGPERERLAALVAEHGLSDCVQLLGQKSQAEVGQLMRQAHVFAFPSIRELGAGVVVEAMACAMACVVVDYGGPAALIGPDRGVKVPMGTLDQLVQRFTTELEALAAQPQRAAALGARAYEHALAHYTWEAKARKTLEVYRWALGQTTAKPQFWAPALAPASA